MKRVLVSLLLPALLVTAPAHANPDDIFEFGRFNLPPPPMAHHGVTFMGGPFPGEALPTDPVQMVMLSERLDLTAGQRQSIGRIVDETAPKLRDLMFRMQDTRKELDAALEAGGDDATLRRLADTQGKLHADLLYLQMSTRGKMRALLNDEQRGKLEDGVFAGRGPFARMRATRPHQDQD